MEQQATSACYCSSRRLDRRACGGASAIEEILKQNHSENLRVFVVWEPILPTDWSSPGRGVRARIPDPRVAQFWDKKHLVAKELQGHLSSLKVDCCFRAGILWDVVAVYPGSAKWDSAPIFVAGPVVDASPDTAKRLLELSGGLR
jgi:hypothetical protein